MISIGRMTEFFHNRFDQSMIEPFSDPKEYNQKYVDQATSCPNPPYNDNCDANPSSSDCLCEYKENAMKYDKMIVKNDTMNGTFGDGKEKQSEIIISNINLGIGIAIMLSYIYSMT